MIHPPPGAQATVDEANKALQQEHNFVSTILDTVDALVVVLDPKGRIVYFNGACERATEYTFAEVRGQPFWDLLLTPEERAPVREVFEELRLRGLPNQFENFWVGKSGERKRIAWSNNVVADETGSVRYVIGTGIDNTERKRAEDALRESERKFRLLADSVPAFFAYVGADERYRFVNSRFEERFGLPPQQIIGKSVRELFGEANYERVRGHIRTVLSGQPVSYEWLAPFPEGEPSWMSVRFEPELDPQGKVTGFFVLAMDVTENRRVEEALRESEAKFRALTESTSAAVLIYQGDYIRYANPAAEALTGFTREELAHMRFWDFTHPDMREVVRGRGLARQRGEPVPARYEQKIVTRNGEVHWLDIAAALTVFEGKPAGIATAFDITERKRIEEALRHSESRTRALLNAIPDLMFRYRLDGTYLDFHAHHPGELALPPDAIVGAKLDQLPLAPAMIDEVMAASKLAVETGQVQTVEYSLDLPAGRQTYEARIVASEPEELVAIVRNITRRKQAEEAIRSSQENLRALTAQLISAREEESKRLARELHDVFSQRLAVLGMETAAVEQKFACADPACCKILHDIGEEIGNLARDVHHLSRDLHPSILDDLGLTAALRAECGAFSRQHKIPVRFEPVRVPESLPSTVSLGLYRIAQESLRNVGKHAGATEVRVTLEGTDGAVCLAVEDNGSGFDFDRIKGRRGLGLVSMEERVRLVEGSLQIRSQPGTGTTVEARIPIGGNAP